MKKALSLFLAVLMLFSVCAASTSVLAEEIEMPYCTCKDCTRVMNGCHCCVQCPYLDETYLLSCAKDENGHYKGSTCCGECSGVWPCSCSCSCCENKDQNPGDSSSEPLIPEKQRETIIKAFQNAIHKVAEVFDKIFDTIFKFLRINDFFGKKNNG